ncbi:MAG: SDR family oxidoreductase [Pseudomonadales bacterium]|nr:SDR family oxidoreductase [Pseudomonadales bacterium]
MARFDNKAVLVTGAASGFGEAIARRFASEGARVLCADIDEKKGPEVVQSIMASGAEAHFVKADVSSSDDVKNMVDTCHERYGAIDILVNNAGYAHLSMLMWKIEEKVFEDVFDVNVKGVFLGCKFAIPYMIEQGGGVIINTASVGAVAPRAGLTPYNATKGAVMTMTKGLALEVARHNIRCNAVNPVAADTAFMKGAMGVDQLDNEQKSALTSTVPRGRLAEPKDVAAAVCFLASDDADLITGTCLNVDGGRSI